MMITLIILWGIGLWLGAFLIFASDPGSVVTSDSGISATIGEKIYFSGYLITTMGLGDFIPKNALWGMVSSLFSFFGLVFITLMVSYILPVLSKLVEKKQLSLFIHHLGNSPEELLLFFWNGRDFTRLKEYSVTLQQQILLIGKSHHAYPILHFFHAHRKEESLVINICLFDEFLSLLTGQIDPSQWDEKEVLPLKRAVSNYLETMKVTYTLGEKGNPIMPQPDLSLFSETKLKLLKNTGRDHKRSAQWFWLLKSKGWTWNEVYPNQKN